MLSTLTPAGLAAPAVLAALVIAGCGSQATPPRSATTHAVSTPAAVRVAVSAAGHSSRRSSTGRLPRRAAAVQRYLGRRMRKPEVDNEGPDKPVAGRAPAWTYEVALTPAPGRAARTGAVTARVTLRGRRVCWQFAHTGSAAMTGATATIHVGAHGRTGPEIVVFGPRFSPRGCIVVRPVVVNSIAAAPHLYYLRLAGRAWPGGAIRAQL